MLHIRQQVHGTNSKFKGHMWGQSILYSQLTLLLFLLCCGCSGGSGCWGCGGWGVGRGRGRGKDGGNGVHDPPQKLLRRTLVQVKGYLECRDHVIRQILEGELVGLHHRLLRECMVRIRAYVIAGQSLENCCHRLSIVQEYIALHYIIPPIQNVWERLGITSPGKCWWNLGPRVLCMRSQSHSKPRDHQKNQNIYNRAILTVFLNPGLLITERATLWQYPNIPGTSPYETHITHMSVCHV